MSPAVLDSLRFDRIPCFSREKHDVQLVDLVNVFIACFIAFNCTIVECSAIVAFESAYDAGVEWLDI